MPTVGLRPDDRDISQPSFGPWKKRITTALVEAILARVDRDDVVAPGPELSDRVTREFEVWVGSAGPTSIFGIGLLLTVIELLPLVYVGSPSRMSSLPLRKRLEYLEQLEHTKIGLLATAVVGVKIPLTMLCYEVGDELTFTGYDRPTISSLRTGTLAAAKAKLPLLGAGSPGSMNVSRDASMVRSSNSASDASMAPSRDASIAPSSPSMSSARRRA